MYAPRDELKETRGYWKLKEEALARAKWRIALGEDMDLS